MLPKIPRSFALIVFSLLLGSLLLWAEGFQSVRARHAMVASVHPEASRVGAKIMREGGNAVDATVMRAMAELP